MVIPVRRRYAGDPIGMRKSPEGSPRRCSGAAWPASGGLSRAAINAWNQHGVPRRPRSPYRLGGDGGRGWAASQQALEVGAPRPAVCPSRCRQLCPTGCLAQHPGQHEQLACRHQLLNLATAGVGPAAVLVAGVGCGSHDGQQVGEPSDRLTGQPYVHPVSPATVWAERSRAGASCRGPAFIEVLVGDGFLVDARWPRCPSAWTLGARRSVPHVTATACPRSPQKFRAATEWCPLRSCSFVVQVRAH
jgi:hypothetical protein